MAQSIPWEEWEAQAQRLHRALRERPADKWTLSSAKALFARVLGHAHWHEVEENLKAHDQLPWNRSDASLVDFPPPPSILTVDGVVAWLSAVTPVPPIAWSPALWFEHGQTVWTWMAPLLIEGQSRGRWTLDGRVALACLRPDAWAALDKLAWSEEVEASCNPHLAVLRPGVDEADDPDAALTALAHAWSTAWRDHLRAPGSSFR